MKIKRLILQGFKSFKDRTVIHFDEGITGIVGPNGCGKSNVVDALFWVMGEQSAKHLRGNSMKDVIFAGSSKYSPSAFAEVSLVLENDDGKHIHIGNQVSSPTEIQLTRKLYRNGETEYRINDLPCRLRDIQEVFMDTGAGAKSYSIIAQGEINRLVQAKPEERRSMIEDVAGITKFKMRKKESLKKIEATEQNLARLNDLQQEIEKNLKSLEKQAGIAEKARDLKEKVQKYDLIVHSHKEFDLLKNFKESRDLIEQKTQANEEMSAKKNILEVGLEEERYRKDEEMSKVEDLQKEYNQGSKELAQAEERLNYLHKTKADKEKLIEQRTKEIDEVNVEITHREARLLELQRECEAFEARGAENEDFSLLMERVEQLKEECEFKVGHLEGLKDDLKANNDALVKCEQEIYRNTTRMEEYAHSLQDMTKEIEALEAQYSGVSAQNVAEREAVNQSEKDATEVKNRESELKESLEQKQAELKTLETKKSEWQKTLIQKESKKLSLIEINNNLSLKNNGLNSFLEKNPEGFKLFGTVLKCESKFEKAVQTLLSDYLEILVSDKSREAEFFNWFLAPNKGIDYMAPQYLDSRDTFEATRSKLEEIVDGDVYSLDSVVNFETEYEHYRQLLKGMFIVDQVDDHLLNNLTGGLEYKAISTLDGIKSVKNLNSACRLSLASEGEGQSVIERNNLIETLEQEIAHLKVESEVRESAILAKLVEVEDVKNKLDQTREESIELRSLFAAKKSALEAKIASFESGFARLEILKNRKNEISKSRLELMESEESLAKKQKELSEKVIELESTVSDLSDDLDMQKSQYDSEKMELNAKLLEAKNYESTLRSFQSQIADVEGQLERLSTRLSQGNLLIEGYQTEVQNIENEENELEVQNQNQAQLLQDKDDVLNLLKDSLTQLLLSMKDREDQVKELNQAINKNEKEMAEHEVKLSQYIVEEEQNNRNIFEKYQIDLRKCLGQFLQFSENDYLELKDTSTMYFMETEEGQKEIEVKPFEFNRRYGQDLKECEQKYKNYKLELSRLGDINWQAIEDYERQKLRADFLKTQEQELKNSLMDLQKAIIHIDEKSKLRFQAAYDEVNTRFQKVFPIIFGGGSAELKIVGDLNDADCGIDIIAQPPGKKMQNINLMSGGEKAMTAVSLIFSIFLVKPSPFCLLDEVDAPLDDANVGRFNELLREMSSESQFILITHNKKTMELNDTLYGVTMQEPGVSKAVSVQLH